MEMVQRLRAWTHARQRLSVPTATAEQALRAVVAVYATHPTAPLALWTRTRALTVTSYRRIDATGKGLRIPAMRGTIFLVPRGSAATIFTAVRPVAARILHALKRQGFSTAGYARCARAIEAAATTPTPSRDLQDVAGIKGEQLGTVLRCMRYEGRLLTVATDSLVSGTHLYVRASVAAPEGLDAGDPNDALVWLAGEYLHAYGPARVEDFAWWAGVTKKAATQALAPHDTIDVGDGLLLPAADRAAFGRTRVLRGTVDLLPKWDAYTMGHAPDGRRRFVHPDVQPVVYTPQGRVGLPGDGNPVVLIDGEAAATWSFSVKDGASVNPFEPWGVAVRTKVEKKLDAVAGFLKG